ncbi:ComEC/Rec2 family competence protein [Pseudooceanicola aestuarii]|uniref:ComEC/Rec2 family competence protein n=1 Tax=Pseudooceanicola aestuarii TaxID=2697319 RepID=UPI0013D77A6E|nr:ComEC/Rec2 family competence protein [Pseudooceanicola aestuarii]
MRRLGEVAAAILIAQRGALFGWAPVCLGTGIGVYFLLGAEPGIGWLAGLACVALGLAALALRAGAVAGPLLWALTLLAAGLSLAGGRARMVGAPVLEGRYYGTIEGRIVGLDRSASDALRVTLDRVRLPDRARWPVPRRVRVSLRGPQGTRPEPGKRVMTTGHLSPPGGPVEPGGFDFQRHAWFLRLGAVGYTRVPLMAHAPPQGAEALVFRARLALSARVTGALPGETGAFAAAVMTGDRSAMAPATLEALRVSNLAHLLAISGLHMGLLAGFVFGAMRLALVLPERIALRWPVKALSAGVALAAAAGYLALSGGNVATERAFVMVAVALIAVMARRRAMSLRSVAIAALIVLFLRPEALLSPGFQMSFAATLGLVAVFGALRGRMRGRGWVWAVASLLISSAVAGAATAPFGAAHFNQVSPYGLAANLSSVPLMGLVVIPAAVVSACLMPLGLEALPLAVMGVGLDWILFVARGVSGWEGARQMVPSPPGWALTTLSAGALMLILWRGPGRWLGLAPMGLALLAWVGPARPPILIADSGGLVGVMTGEGRALSRPRGAGFIASVWLENDGDPASQEEAAARRPGRSPVIHVTGKRAVAELTGCAAGTILVLNHPAPEGLRGCTILDPDSLRQTGAIALWPAGAGAAEPTGIATSDQGWRMITAQSVTGRRFWNTPGLWHPLAMDIGAMLP